MSGSPSIPSPATAVGLFAGIGGIEKGLAEAGFETAMLCEIDPNARRVLTAHFPGVRSMLDDVRTLEELPPATVVAAGFPCQDLSQAGRGAGIDGPQSGLIQHVFALLQRGPVPDWLVLENVPFMLQLDRGEAMRYLTRSLSELGLRWAYRVVDTRAFGIPQRRRRVILVASATRDPRGVLFTEDVSEPPTPPRIDTARPSVPCGFYWTEGLRGLGWAVNSVPTLKGGSTVGIPSSPAIWNPSDGSIITPDIRDAERLQGFEADWTAAAVDDPTRRNGPRWKLVGNAVSVPVARWLGVQLSSEPPAPDLEYAPLGEARWPVAAWGDGTDVYEAPVSAWPCQQPMVPLDQFLQYPPRPISKRAAAGFLTRARRGRLRFPPGFLEDVAVHAGISRERAAA